MSDLTHEVKDWQSPVAEWLSTTFPRFKEIQAEFRIGAGPQQILMPAEGVSMSAVKPRGLVPGWGS